MPALAAIQSAWPRKAARVGETTRRRSAFLASAFVIVVAIGAALLGACGTPGSTVRPPEPQNSALPWSDAGVPPPLPSTSTRRGVIVPSDTGLGSTPSGSFPVTGTSGGAVGPTLGSPTGGGN